MSENRLKWTLTGDPNQKGLNDGGVRSMTGKDIDMVFQPIVDIETGLLFRARSLGALQAASIRVAADVIFWPLRRKAPSVIWGASFVSKPSSAVRTPRCS